MWLDESSLKQVIIFCINGYFQYIFDNLNNNLLSFEEFWEKDLIIVNSKEKQISRDMFLLTELNSNYIYTQVGDSPYIPVY